MESIDKIDISPKQDENNDNYENIKKLSDINLLYIGKTPNISISKSSHLIGIIDCSGSMSSHFEMLCDAWNSLVLSITSGDISTILFSSEAKIKEKNILEKHDCFGSTNILSGFTLAFEEIEKLKKEGKDDFMILFISDGEDDKSHTMSERIKKMNFVDNASIKLICIGVGKNFPTFLSMELRLKYHNNSPSIPPVFLVFTDYDYQNKVNEFVKTFDEIKINFLQKYEIYNIKTNVFRLPWELTNSHDKFEEGNYYISLNENNLFNDEINITNIKLSELKQEETLQVFKIWLQNLLLSSLNKPVRKEAEIFHEIASFKFEQLKSEQEKNPINKIVTLKERLDMKTLRSKNAEFDGLLAEIKRLKIGNSLKDLTQDEAAKRLAIGTLQGKFHNKALQMRGITQNDFEKYKKEFLKILLSTKFSEKTSNQENSLTILQNQKDIFQDPDLYEFLNNSSLYEILDVIPIVGHTCQILISDSAMINPYNVEVIYIPKINKSCDTYTLIENGNSMEIPIGSGQKEYFNAVLPLFDESDTELGPLLRSNLFHLMMTFITMRNLDTFFPEAYLALLSNFLVKIIKEPSSQWREDTIDKIVFTAELIYGNSKLINKTIELLSGNDPRLALITEKVNLDHKCENVSKIVLVLLIMKKRAIIPVEKIEKIIDFMIIESTGRVIKNLKEKDIFEIYNGEEVKEDFTIAVDLRKTMNKNTNNELNNNINDLNNLDDFSIDIEDDLRNNINKPKTNKSNKTHGKITQNEKVDSDGISLHLKLTINVESIKTKFLSEKIKEKDIEKFEDIKSLKLKFKEFFQSNYSMENLKSNNKLMLNQKTLNKQNMKFNFSFWYKLNDYLIGSQKKLNSEIFWIAVHHCLKYNNSLDRNEKNINYNYNEIKEKQTIEFLHANLKNFIEFNYEITLKNFIEQYLKDKNNTIKLIRDFNCSTELLKNKATFNDNFSKKSAIFLGLKGSGKSSLIGKILEQLNLIDQDIFKIYKICYKTIFNERENAPYEWISNTNADERISGFTMNTNISHINYNGKYINIYDTPGKFEYFKNSLKDLYLGDSFFICLEANRDCLNNNNNKNFIKNILKFLFIMERIKHFYVVITKIDRESNDEILGETVKIIQNQISEILLNIYNQLGNKYSNQMDFTIIPLSVFNNHNITIPNKKIKYFENSENVKISEESLLEILLEFDKNNTSVFEKIDNFKNNSLNRFYFSSDKEFLTNNKDISNSNDSFKAILLTRKINKNKFNKKLIYAKVISGCLDNSDYLLFMPNLNISEINSININYQGVNTAHASSEITILLKRDYLSLELERDINIIYAFNDEIQINDYINNLVKKNLKLNKKEDNIDSVDAVFEYLGKPNLKKHSRINIDFKGFTFTLYIENFEKIDLDDFHNSNKIQDNKVNEDEYMVKGNKYKILLKPVTKIYFENIYWEYQNMKTMLFTSISH